MKAITKKKSRFRFLIFILALLVIFFIWYAGINRQANIISSDTAFFLWMDGYAALSENEQITIAYTLYSKEDCSQAFDQIAHVSFPQNDLIRVNDFSWDTLSAPGYFVYSLNLTLSGAQPGNFTNHSLLFEYDTAEKLEMPIGEFEWVIVPEVNGNDYVDRYSSPAANANAQVYPCKYSMTAENTFFQKVSCGNLGQYDSPSHAQQIFVKIPLSSDAPLKYIRPLIEINQDGNIMEIPGESCYCGAINFDRHGVELSEQHNLLSAE